MSNKLDPVHAVTSMALALVEIQKDVATLFRQHSQLTDTVVKMDSALISKFKEVDKIISYCLGNIDKDRHAADPERTKNTEVDEEDVRSEESEASILCDDPGEEIIGSGEVQQEG